VIVVRDPACGTGGTSFEPTITHWELLKAFQEIVAVADKAGDVNFYKPLSNLGAMRNDRDFDDIEAKELHADVTIRDVWQQELFRIENVKSFQMQQAPPGDQALQRVHRLQAIRRQGAGFSVDSRRMSGAIQRVRY
jgi:hypothetical protein